MAGCDAPLTSEALNKDLKPHLKDVIKKKITINDTEAKLCVKIMEHTVTTLLAVMKKVSPLFNDLYQKPVYTGSYYDGLRVSAATEFDLNLVLRLPFSPDEVEIQNSTTPAFVKYRLKVDLVKKFAVNHPKWTPELYKKLIIFFDDKKYLLQEVVKRWMEGVIQSSQTEFKRNLPKEVKNVELRKQGPAFTLGIFPVTGKRIDVDLVPVIDGSQYSMPNNLCKSRRFSQLPAVAQHYFLVPKQPGQNDASAAVCGTCWRIAFPEAEKQLLSNLASVKPLIKLFKLLRDENNWVALASYYIKSLFLLVVDEHPNPEYWNEKLMGTRFIEMLHKLQVAISERKITYYFNRKANLLENFGKCTANEWSNWLIKMIKTIEKDPSKILGYYHM